MRPSLVSLEQQRSVLQNQLAELGDFRAGSITGTGGRCGNPRCHCHETNDPGHGPYYRLTRKVKGKTVTETFSTEAALRKAQREVEEYHRFRRLSQELLEVNEQICRLRPVLTAPLIAEKKNGRGNSRRDFTRTELSFASDLPRMAAERTLRPGSDGNEHSCGNASDGRQDSSGTVAVCWKFRTGTSVSVWPESSLPRDAFSGRSYGGRTGKIPTTLLPVLLLPPGAKSAGRGAGCGKYRLFSGSTPHDGTGG